MAPLLVALFLAACAKINYGSGVTPDTTPTPESTPLGICNVTQTASIVIGIAGSFTVVKDPTFGQVAGYANVTSGLTTGAGIITAKVSDTIQFANLETDGTTEHSAVALISTGSPGFPPIPYTFPNNAETPSTSTVIGATPWSTGRIPAGAGLPCVSEQFTLTTPGNYYFGDLDLYNTITSFRDVLVVTP